jgi:AcrR family transcriptional regulator
MSSVAKMAGVPIGSLYQYFPTKAALLYRLFEARLEEFRTEMRKQLQLVNSSDDFRVRMRSIIFDLYKENRSDPFMRALWAGVQASPETRELLAADNAFYSQLFYETARRVGSKVPSKQLRIRATVINDMWDSALRTAITMDDPSGVELIKESLDIGLRAFFGVD